jgi:hypothetical protein
LCLRMLNGIPKTFAELIQSFIALILTRHSPCTATYEVGLCAIVSGLETLDDLEGRRVGSSDPF